MVKRSDRSLRPSRAGTDCRLSLQPSRRLGSNVFSGSLHLGSITRIAHGYTMTRNPAISPQEAEAIDQIDAALSALIRLMAEQAARETLAVALAEEAHSHGAEEHN